MLEKPALHDDQIIVCVQDAFGLKIEKISFLPLGADMHSAVYRVVTEEQKVYFLKLRSGYFIELSVRLPTFLNSQGIDEIIAPLATKMGELWAYLNPFRVMLYPFIEGEDAYTNPLSDSQWRQFGAALKAVHTAVLPPSLTALIPQENYSSKWRQLVAHFMKQIQSNQFTELIARQAAAFLNAKHERVAQLLQETENLAQKIQNVPQVNMLCHSDIHAWNLLISADGAIYIVDWDDPILAPIERDLMFIGAGLGNVWNTPREKELFYDGYGPTAVDSIILAYYRGERIIQDIAEYCKQLLLSDIGGKDREQALQNLASNFLPNGTIDVALRFSLNQN